jgi:glyoxylase-like metal-dependent hydrolase (beta-lactamase superfamily II)/rhodanese-related sulfurtransferase
MSGPLVVPVVDEGLGNSTYLLDLGGGRGLVVDPSRDLRAVRVAADRAGLRIGFAVDTHLHADFLSGSRQLAISDSAQLLASAAGQREYPHTGLRDGDEVDLGGLVLRAVSTPGHTHEHLAYLLLDGPRPVGVFTGGSLLVGSAARTDLVDPARTEESARAQYRSLRRLADLGDDVAVWPTHGAGSFCSAPPGSARTSTIGTEKATNTLLRAADEGTFVRDLLGSLGSYPPYFRWLGEINRRGPALLAGTPTLPALAVDRVRALIAAGALIVDVRPVAAFAAGHPAGAVSIPLRPVFATWLGWLVPPDRPLVIVRDDDQDPDEIVWQATKIGYDWLAGQLHGGMTAWRIAGASVARLPLVTAAQLDGARLLDIRQAAEYAAGHVPGALHLELGDVAARAGELPGGPMVVMCGHGERAMSAASLLARSGHHQLAVLDGGPDSWAAATGRPLQQGT